ncbi:MAG TPA: NAD(P)/FAD-dependent oxidoreductase [Kribbella sp.]|jgi:2-polyprenyl-6-methoxyphenol hydroxylase-like FAD-dependent oxidoreductase
MADIAIIGAGPGGLTAAIALARRGVRTTVFERDAHPERTPRFNPDRSYAIDITGHGLRALRHIDALTHFDAGMIQFRGIRFRGVTGDRWSEPGWIGSRGDIMRTLMAVVDDRHRDLIQFEFESDMSGLDVHAGVVAGRRFDLVIGADGAGSAVRTAMQEQVEGFTVETSFIPNYAIMMELDRAGDQLDKHYLHVLGASPFLIAGAIIDENKPEGVRWLCMVGVGQPTTFTSPEDATAWLRKHCAPLLDLVSEQAIAEFSQRQCQHLGRRLTCSHLHGGRVVLLGDAAAAFPPIGQGVNAAMESAIVLDQCLATGPLETAAARYEAAWKPEAEAVSWIGEQMLFQKPWNGLRPMIAFLFGLRAVGRSKSATASYADAQRVARRLGSIKA